MLHSHLNDMEISETKRFIPKGFELGTTLRACLHRVGDPGLVGFSFFCFHALGDTKQKKPTPLDRGPPLHVNRVLVSRIGLFPSRVVGLIIGLHLNL